MIVLTNTIAQTLAPGQSLAFDEVILRKGCNECHRKNTASVKLRSNGVYAASFHGNVDGATAEGPAQLALTLGGSPLLETTMISSTTGINNVGTETLIQNCCGDYDRVSVTNTGTVPVVVSPNANLILYKKGN